MREAILEAAATGQLSELRIPIELNEMKPVIGNASVGDPIEAIRQLSPGSESRDILAALGRVLASSWVAVAAGPDIENSRVYVWPKFAETGIASLGKDDEAELNRLMPSKDLAAMAQSGVYSYWRIGIGADGTWHYLRR